MLWEPLFWTGKDDGGKGEPPFRVLFPPSNYFWSQFGYHFLRDTPSLRYKETFHFLPCCFLSYCVSSPSWVALLSLLLEQKFWGGGQKLCLFCSLNLEQCLAHNRYSINKYLFSERMNDLQIPQSWKFFNSSDFVSAILNQLLHLENNYLNRIKLVNLAIWEEFHFFQQDVLGDTDYTELKIIWNFLKQWRNAYKVIRVVLNSFNS